MSVRVLDKEGLRKVFVGLSGLSDFATSWELSPDPFVGDQDRVKINLKLTNMRSIGVDEHRTALNPPGYPATAFVTTELGNRLFTIQVKVEAYDADVEAIEIIDALRTGIRAEDTNAKLYDLMIALVEIMPAIMLPTSYDNRVVSVAACDFVFAGIAQKVSKVEIDQGYIETIDGTADGHTIPGNISS